MYENNSVVGATTLIVQTPYETALEKINQYLPKIAVENTKIEKQERLEQLEKLQRSFLYAFVEIVSCIFNINTLWCNYEKVEEFCVYLSVDELIAFEKSFSQYPVIKSSIGFFASFTHRHLSFYCSHTLDCQSNCNHKIFTVTNNYFSRRKELSLHGGEKAVEETLKKFHENMSKSFNERKEAKKTSVC